MSSNQSGSLPSALEHQNQIIERLLEKRPIICLDYDGTLTPIVDDPSQALLSTKMKLLLQQLAEYWTVVVLTGRALDDIKKLVGLKKLVYAGSHGFNIVGPNESFHEEPEKEFLPEIDQAEKELETAISNLKRVQLERKRYAIAIHYRRAEDSILPELEKHVDRVVEKFPKLIKTTGKKIFELRPNTDWHKGKALLYLLEKLHIDGSRILPLYIGDDTTDEDAFRAISDRGIGILVSDDDKETAAHYVVQNTDEVAEFLDGLITFAKQEASSNVWTLAYQEFNPESEKHREALCTLGNGYFATRGAAPEAAAGDIHYPGTYVAGVYNRLNSTITDKTVENESMVNVPNWLVLDFCIENGDWFDLSSVNILDYRQNLDMQQGILERDVFFEDSENRRTRLKQRRFVHMSHRHLAGLETVIVPENWSGTLQVRSALDGRVENALVERYQQLNNHHLEQLGTGVTDDQLMWIQVRTNQSHIRIAMAASTNVFIGDKDFDKKRQSAEQEGFIYQDFSIEAKEGQSVRVEKIISIYDSRDPAISESLMEATSALRHADTFATLLKRHTISWKHLWERWSINIQSNSQRVQQILNLHVFHLLQTVSPNSIDLDVGVPPRGLHGEAYRGLIMWDELFIFPLLNLRMPDITRALLMYRYHRLSRALWSAKEKGYRGAMFPWQSGSNGQEQAQDVHLNPASGRWIPDDSQLQRHINIAIAYNVWQYYQVTGDENFLSFYGSEFMILIARFWASKAQYNKDWDRYEIKKVMGPDEFHERYPDSSEPGIDNNAYTNIMTAWIMVRTLEMLDKLPRQRRQSVLESLSVQQEEIDFWDKLSRKLHVPFHDDGIISQFENYDKLEEFDWEGYRKKYENIQRLDRILEAEGDSPNRYKVSKQADVLMLFYLLSSKELQSMFERLEYPFTEKTIENNINYYLERTSHGSTLSRVVHAWVLSRSKREMSWDLFRDALESDVEDIQGGTTLEGIHLGAMAGTVDLILRCYTGIESRGDVLWFNPYLPSELLCLEFSIMYRWSWIDVKVTADRLELRSRGDTDVSIKVGFRDETYSLAPGEKREFDI